MSDTLFSFETFTYFSLRRHLLEVLLGTARSLFCHKKAQTAFLSQTEKSFMSDVQTGACD